ncbi:MAG: hypothetical protein DID92_2727743344 [Candidatus Nitrotoga sp. SPKER]|nr:MAG: hypothetical protein DID92_2727743344 [Candidatus Nitrotoga sp. SPKER]
MDNGLRVTSLMKGLYINPVPSQDILYSYEAVV